MDTEVGDAEGLSKLKEEAVGFLLDAGDILLEALDFKVSNTEGTWTLG